jgi:hypothetical protein
MSGDVVLGRAERDGEHEEYVDILSESFNYVYNDLDGTCIRFQTATTTMH